MNHYETVFILNPVLSETQIEKQYKSIWISLPLRVDPSQVQKTGGSKNWPIPFRTKKAPSTI